MPSLFPFSWLYLFPNGEHFAVWAVLPALFISPFPLFNFFVTRLVYTAGKALLFRHGCSHRAWRKNLLFKCFNFDFGVPFFGKLLFWGLSSTTLFFWDLPAAWRLSCLCRDGRGVLFFSLLFFFFLLFWIFLCFYFSLACLHHCKPTSPFSQEAQLELERREKGGGGSSWQWNTWNTLDSNSVSLSLTLLTHSIAWTGVWKLDPVFSECLQNVNTHTPPLPPPPFPPYLLLLLLPRSSSMPVAGFLSPSLLVSSFCLPPSHCFDTTWPPPLASLRVLGCEMHNQCNIHKLNYVFFFFNKYCTACIFFSLFVCTFFSPSPFAFNLFVNM